MSLRDTILADDAARIAQRDRHEQHARGLHARAVEALRGALAADADPGPIDALAAALDVDRTALVDVLRERATEASR